MIAESKVPSNVIKRACGNWGFDQDVISQAISTLPKGTIDIEDALINRELAFRLKDGEPDPDHPDPEREQAFRDGWVEGQNVVEEAENAWDAWDADSDEVDAADEDDDWDCPPSLTKLDREAALRRRKAKDSAWHNFFVTGQPSRADQLRVDFERGRHHFIAGVLVDTDDEADVVRPALERWKRETTAWLSGETPYPPEPIRPYQSARRGPSPDPGTTRLQDAAPEAPTRPVGLSVGQLLNAHPKKRPVIIEGFLREGETCNVIGAAKAGKSWLILGLMMAVALGLEWLGHQAAAGRVLLIDNELHPEELAARIRTVAEAMEIDPADLEGRFDVIPFRGHLGTIAEIKAMVPQIQSAGYTLIALDAFYRFLPEGTSENDNQQMMQLYNTLDSIAADLGCAIVLNHHSSKGDQSQKAVTDVGAGAGAISRAADSHLIIRPHQLESCAVLEGACRTFAPVAPRTIRWEYPLWHLMGIEPELKQRKNPQQETQAKNDRETEQMIIQQLTKHVRLTNPQLRTRTGFGAARVTRGLARLVDSGQVNYRRMKKKTGGKSTEVYQLAELAP